MAKLTAKEIAQALNISTSTVSRVLNNNGRISEKTRQQVFHYIQEHNPDSPYLQNTKTSRVVGIIVGKVSNEFSAKIIENLQSSLSLHNILLVLMYANYSAQKERQSILSLVENHVDCIVSLTTRHATIKRHELKGIPMITLDNNNPLIDDTPDYCVLSDQYIGGVLATEELIQKGCQRIAYFTNVGSSLTDNKLKGYQDTLKKHNIPYNKELIITSGTHSENTIEDARKMTEYLLTKNIQFDGVFATSDKRALGILNALHNYGISCPEQIKVVGYDASTLSESFQITSISQDASLIARNCFLYILKIFGKEDKSQIIKLPIPVFLVKGTTT